MATVRDLTDEELIEATEEVCRDHFYRLRLAKILSIHNYESEAFLTLAIAKELPFRYRAPLQEMGRRGLKVDLLKCAKEALLIEEVVKIMREET